MLNSNDTEAQEYIERATAYALAGTTNGLSRHGGRFVGSDTWRDERGYWLRVRSTLDDLPGVEIRYSRILLLATGPEKDAETEGIIFGSGFEERLHTRARAADPVDGVITL